ncbi:hypothetical protein BDY21DRAFT_388298 [Lineolata rhizophorae]|uniref:Aminoglycoside phosphotransferase domain-containing protein n=1 Tax=Lineolata rhizophorae TaxID=578093 RepID=A0A6A6NN55_9PEZI|nr:hypothetical protein BDY21DRAFT_388298 [Lineolata rhizophorae]
MPSQTDAMNPPAEESEATKFNRMVMRKLQKAIASDAEVDITSVIPRLYSEQLAARKVHAQNDDDPAPKGREVEEPSQFSKGDLRSNLSRHASPEVLFPLAESVKTILGCDEQSPSFADNLVRMAREAETLWEPRWAGLKMVLRCGSNIALKIMMIMDDTTEYTSLQYLREKKPTVPVPEPLGLAWPRLDEVMKRSVQHQLDDMFTELRALPYPRGMPLGGVGGEGCKDLRRHVRRSEAPIWTVQQFDDWQFSNPHFGSQIYINVIRRLSPPLSQNVVFSHNDLRTENVMVSIEDGRCVITGIVDWEYSGFYPEHYECTKVMNSIQPNEDCDWFLFIPDCISPIVHPQKWLQDAVWWKHVE